MHSPQNLPLFNKIIYSSGDLPQIPDATLRTLLLRGIIYSLKLEATPENIRQLYEYQIHSAYQEVQVLALDELISLARENNSAASDALYELALHHNNIEAHQAIEKHHINTHQQDLKSAYLFIYNTTEVFYQHDPSLSLLSHAYLYKSPAPSKERLIKHAQSSQFQNWATIVQSVEQNEAQSFDILIENYSLFIPIERKLALDLIEDLAVKGSFPAQETICRLVIYHEDNRCKTIANKNDYKPNEAIERALFFFLTENWEAYEKLDFNYSLLTSAYENSPEGLKNRILTHSRQSGYTKWIQEHIQTSKKRKLSDLNDADWELLLNNLVTSKKFDHLWRLAQLAPATWSASIINMLVNNEWQPTSQDGLPLWETIKEQAILCKKTTLDMTLVESYRVPDKINCLTISNDGKYIAAGGNIPTIHLLPLKPTQNTSDTIQGAVPLTRAITFSPDSKYCITARGDNNIYIHRLSDKKMVKAISGHQSLIRDIEMHPDGNSLYSASFDNTIRSWRIPQGTLLWNIDAGTEMFALEISQDGNHLITAGANPDLTVRKLPNGDLIRNLTSHTENVLCLSKATSHKLIGSYARDKTINIWNYSTGKILQSIKVNTLTDNEIITNILLLSNENHLISSTSMGQISLWNTANGSLMHSWRGHDCLISAIAIDPEGETLITAGIDGMINLWDLSTFLICQTPLDILQPTDNEKIQDLINQDSITNNTKIWLKFTHEIIKWRQRFDILLETPTHINIGEFDIEL